MNEYLEKQIFLGFYATYTCIYFLFPAPWLMYMHHGQMNIYKFLIPVILTFLYCELRFSFPTMWHALVNEERDIFQKTTKNDYRTKNICYKFDAMRSKPCIFPPKLYRADIFHLNDYIMVKLFFIECVNALILFRKNIIIL